MRGLFVVTALCAMSLSVFAQNDVYFIPSKEVNEVQVNKQKIETTVEDVGVTRSVIPQTRDVDEYNRRGNAQSVDDERDTVVVDSDVEGIDNYSCSKMIIRFHSPAGVIVSSPYYWDICYGNTWDVYYDAWAWGLPSWSFWSYAYDPWYYNRWWYRSCWDYTWGWYDPWWGYSYWGWGRPIFWGWNRPYYGGWGYAHHIGYSHWGHGGHRFAPGFGRTLGGGRDFADGRRVTRGSAGGFVTRGGNGSRGLSTTSGTRGYTGRGLTKSFRVDQNTSARSMASAGGGRVTRGNSGGFSRNTTSGTTSRSNTNVRSRGSYNNTDVYNRRSTTTSPSRSYGGNTRSYQGTTSRSNTNTSTSTPSRSYSSGSSSSSRSGGYSSGGGSVSRGGGGASRGGGGGFSRGGGGGRR